MSTFVFRNNNIMPALCNCIWQAQLETLMGTLKIIFGDKFRLFPAKVILLRHYLPLCVFPLHFPTKINLF